MEPWAATLDGPRRDRAVEVLRQIAAALAPLGCVRALGAHARGGAGLLHGHAGVGLFFAYLERAGLGSGFASAGDAHMEVATEAVASATLPAAFDVGLAGIAWTVQHLSAPSEEDACEDIDPVLLQFVDREVWDGHFDVTEGLVGFALYALERMQRPAARELLRSVVRHLGTAARRSPDGASWVTPPRHLPGPWAERFPGGVVNLGLAHGMPSVLVILAAALRHGVEPTLAAELLEEGLRWMLTRAGAESPAFPDLVDGSQHHRATSYFGWCYGDPAVVTALLQGAEALHHRNFRDQALELGRRAACHRPSLPDAILCHGTGGNAQMFGRLFQRLGEPRFQEAAAFWAERTLEVQRPSLGFGGFPAFRPWLRPDDPFLPDPSFLVGAAGVGLSLLAAVSPVEPDWDRALLLSTAAPSGPEGRAQSLHERPLAVDDDHVEADDPGGKIRG